MEERARKLSNFEVFWNRLVGHGQNSKRNLGTMRKSSKKKKKQGTVFTPSLDIALLFSVLHSFFLATSQKRHRAGKTTGKGNQLVRDRACFLREGSGSLTWKGDDHEENP